MAAGLGADLAQSLAWLEQLGQLLTAYLQRLPLPVAGCGPAQALVVERQVGHATAGGIDEAATQAMGEKTREQQHLVRTIGDVGLMLGDPVDLGLATEMIDRLLGPRQLEQPAPGALNPSLHLGAALVEPENRRAQRRTLLVDMDDAAALRGHGHSLDQAAVDVHLLPQQPARLAETGPVVFRVLLCPARLAGEIGIQLDLALG